MPSSDYVVVRFSEPVLGEDPDSGEEFTSDRHRVVADHMHQDASIAEFISEEGEIVAAWPTPLLVKVEWPPSPNALDDAVVPLSWAEKLVKIREKYPSAFTRWSPEEEEELKRLFHLGLTLEEISLSLGRGIGGIHARLKLLGLVDPSMSRAEIDEAQRRKREQRPDTKDER